MTYTNAIFEPRALPGVACLPHREAELPELTALAVNARDGSSDLPLSIPPVSAVLPAETRWLAELASGRGWKGPAVHGGSRGLGNLRFPVLDEDGRRKHFAGGVFASTASEGQRVAARAAERAGPSRQAESEARSEVVRKSSIFVMTRIFDSRTTPESSGRGLPRHESSIPFTNH